MTNVDDLFELEDTLLSVYVMGQRNHGSSRQAQDKRSLEISKALARIYKKLEGKKIVINIENETNEES